MPNLLYRPAHKPPRWWEHLLAHGHGIAVALASLGAGLQVLVTLTTRHVLSRATDTIPPAGLAIMCGMLLAGAVLYVTGIMGRFRLLATAQLLVQAGLVCMGGGWMLRSVALYVRGAPQDSTAALVSLSLFVGCALALIGSYVSAPRIARDVAVLRGADE